MKKNLISALLFCLTVITTVNAQNALLMKDITPGAASSELTILGHVDDILIFTNKPSGAPAQLWASDGTAAGTIQLATAQANNARFVEAVSNDSKLVCLEYDQATLKYDFWVTEGTVATTIMLTQPSNAGSLNNLQFFMNELYYSVNHQIRKVDLNDASDVLVLQADNDIVDFFWGGPGRLYYGKYPSNGAHDDSLYFYNAGNNTTTNIMSIGNSYFKGFKQYFVNGYFLIFNEVYNSTLNLYATDGTSAGSTLLKSFNTAGLGSANEVVVENNKIYFDAVLLANDPDVREYEAWVSDGTNSGTYSLYSSSNQINYAGNFCVFNGLVYFMAQDNSDFTTKCYVTNGNINGTTPYLSSKIVASSTSFSAIAATNDYLIMVAQFKGHALEYGAEFWMKGIATVEQFYEAITGSSDLYSEQLHATSNLAFFVGYDGTYGYELYRISPTAPVIVSISEVESDVKWHYAPNPVEDELYFNEEMDRIAVWDIHGNLLKDERKQQHVSLTELSSGVYFVNIQKSETSKTFKIVKP